MLPADLNHPELDEPYHTALQDALVYIFTTYRVVGLLATGTIVRGTADPRSDLDLHVLHSDRFRQRVQKTFNGVPAEIFVNPPDGVPAYFAEDNDSRRPISAHMFATGVVVYDPHGSVKRLVEMANTYLAMQPLAPSDLSQEAMKYSVACEFEDVLDLSERDLSAAKVLLGSVVRNLAHCRVAVEPGWLPRSKDLMQRLREVDPEAAQLAELAASHLEWQTRLEVASQLCQRVTGAIGFFDWEGPRQEVPSPPLPNE